MSPSNDTPKSPKKAAAKTRPPEDDASIAEQIAELAGKVQITHIALLLGIGRKKAGRIAKEYNIPVAMSRKRDPNNCSTAKERYRAVRECDYETWKEFMLFGPVRVYTAWQHPEAMAPRT